jgi:hypothetical protein
MATTSLQFVGDDYGWLFLKHFMLTVISLQHKWVNVCQKGKLLVSQVTKCMNHSVSNGTPFITLCII